jgi:hypothetical protein
MSQSQIETAAWHSDLRQDSHLLAIAYTKTRDLQIISKCFYSPCIAALKKPDSHLPFSPTYFLFSMRAMGLCKGLLLMNLASWASAECLSFGWDFVNGGGPYCIDTRSSEPFSFGTGFQGQLCLENSSLRRTNTFSRMHSRRQSGQYHSHPRGSK